MPSSFNFSCKLRFNDGSAALSFKIALVFFFNKFCFLRGQIWAINIKRPTLPVIIAATGKEAGIRLAFADTLRMLTSRINIFVSLPIRSLDQLSLQRQLDAIGKTKDGKPASAA